MEINFGQLLPIMSRIRNNEFQETIAIEQLLKLGFDFNTSLLVYLAVREDLNLIGLMEGLK